MMIIKNAVIIGLSVLTLTACSDQSETSAKDESEVATEVKSESDESSSKENDIEVVEVAKDHSFDDKSIFKITKKEVGENPGTGEQNLDIYVNNEKFKSPIKITQDIAYSKVDPGSNGVPKNAVFAFSTWFAGGGSVYFGVVKNGVLQINVKYEDEGMSSPGKFSLYREIDPNVLTKTPDYYISYTSDDKKSKELMIAFTQNGKALFAKYYGQSRQIELKFSKDASKGKNIVEYYDEMVGGEVNGTYKLTHSGNYDYAEYTNKKSGKKYAFTINHNVTIMDDTYRTVPSL